MRRKRAYLVGALALALAVSVAGIGGAAAGDTIQTFKAKVKPNKLPKKKRKGVALTVKTTVAKEGADGQPDPDVVPAKAKKVKIDFDDDLKFTTKGLAKCKANISALTAEQARQACKKAQVSKNKGTKGEAKLPNPNGGVITLPAKVTAFNGPPRGKKPVILLHTDAAGGAVINVLTGVLKKSRAGKDFGKRLDVAVPPLGGGAAAISVFKVKVKKTYRSRGKKRKYISARCKDKNRKLNSKALFKYTDAPKETVKSKQKCKRKR